MELPTYHMPGFRNLMLHLWDKMKHFIEKAFTIILASTIVIWFLSNFSWDWSFVGTEGIETSILASIGKLILPFFTPLGFGSQLGNYGWMFAVAALTGLIAKENVIATFGSLAACIITGFEGTEEGVAEVAVMIQATGISMWALIAFIAFNMLTIPCFAAVATAKAEIGKGKFRWTLLFWVFTSYLVSCMVYTVGEFWWTAFVWAAVAAIVTIAIVIHNKRADKKAALMKK
jgi:ferrous iron transport protein B